METVVYVCNPCNVNNLIGGILASIGIMLIFGYAGKCMFDNICDVTSWRFLKPTFDQFIVGFAMYMVLFGLIVAFKALVSFIRWCRAPSPQQSYGHI